MGPSHIKRFECVFGDEWLNFKALLIESGSVVAGSFLLQCILDETWHYSTKTGFPYIDIYLPVPESEHHFTKLNSWICKHFAYHSQITDTGQSEILNIYIYVSQQKNYKNPLVSDVESTNNPTPILMPAIRTYCLNIPLCETEQFLRTYYKMDVNRNVFGFSSVGKPFLRINNLQQILSKQIRMSTDIDFNPEMTKTLYIKHGFAFL